MVPATSAAQGGVHGSSEATAPSGIRMLAARCAGRSGSTPQRVWKSKLTQKVVAGLPASHPVQSLAQIPDEGLMVFNADREPHQVVGDAAQKLVLRGQPGVRQRRRVLRERFGGTERHGEAEDLQAVEKSERFLLPAANVE